MDKQYNAEELNVLTEKKIAVIGCGSLGGYVLEMLARLNTGEIVVVDDDTFSAENLNNRQIMSNYSSLGKYKVNEAVMWIKQVNPDIYVKGIVERLNKDNSIDILEGVDMVMDCVDNVESKFILQSACEKLDIPLIHSSAYEWSGQVCTILPKDRTLDKIYKQDKNRELSEKKVAVIPSAIASYQVAECIKVFLKKGELIRNKVLHIDMLNNQSKIENLLS